MAGRPNMIDTATYARKLLWFCGLYHGKRYPKYAYFALVRAVILTELTLFPTLILLKILDGIELAMLFKQLIFFFVLTSTVLRAFLQISTLPKMHTVEDLLESEIFNMQNEEQDGFISAIGARQRNMVRLYLPIFTIAMGLFILYPIVTQTFINIPIWTPFDGDVEEVAIYVFETFYVLIEVLIYAALDAVFLGFISCVVAQIQLLKDNLEHSADRNSEEDYAKQEEKIQGRLGICIAHHNAILDLMRRLEDFFSPTLFCQVIFAALEVCFGAIIVVIETNRAQLILWSMCLLIAVGTVMIFCWCGQDIITESSGIIEACYMSKWYTCPPPTRKMFFIIMEQAKRTIELSGGDLFILSFNTFVKVLRSAYSYYAVFSQVYQK